MIKSIMELTKITDVSEKLIKFLSKGYKQRVGLAAAIVGYPEILILDEPTVGLDPKQIIEIRELIKSLSKKHTILLSSHIMQEIDAVCDKIIIINKGKLIAYDTPANIARVMENSRELHITVCGSEMTVRRALDYVDGIKKLDVRYSDATGMSDITIKMNEGCDVRKNVSEKLMDAKCPIIEMKLHEVSIEEIFLKLTNSNNKEDK